MFLQVTKWGNGIGIRIPQPVAKDLNWKVGMPVKIDFAANNLVVRKPKYLLATLLAQVTPDNIHAETDFDRVDAA